MEYTEQELEVRNDFEKFEKKYGKKELLEVWDEKILAKKNPALSAYFAKLDGEHAKEHADIVLKSCNLEAIYELSNKYPEHLEYIINSHDFEYNFRGLKRAFNREVEKTSQWWKDRTKREEAKENITKFVESLSKSDVTDDLVSFLEWYNENLIVTNEFRNPDYNKCYNNSFFSSDSREYILANVGMTLLADSSKYINTIINKIAKSDNADKLYEAFHWQKSISNIIKFRGDFTDNFKYNYILRDAIIKMGNAQYNYELACESGCSISALKKHEDAVIQSQDLRYIYLFARCVKNADVSRLLKAILESKDPMYNYLCLENIPEANKAEHLSVIAESKDLEYNYKACLLGLGNDMLNKKVVLESKSPSLCYELASKFPNDPFFYDYVEIIRNSDDNWYKSKLSELQPIIIDNINEKIKKLDKVDIK